MDCKNRINFKGSLEDFKKNRAAYLDKTFDELSDTDFKNLQDYLYRQFEGLSRDHKELLKVFSGKQKYFDIKRDDLDSVGQYVRDIRLDKGDENYGAVHIVKRHFGDAGDLNGGKLDWIDLISLGEVVKKGIADIDLKSGRHKYTYEMNDKKYVVIVEKHNNKKHKLITYFTDDAYESKRLNAFDNSSHTNGRVRGTDPKGDTPPIGSDDSISKNDVQINSMVIPFPTSEKMKSFINQGIENYKKAPSKRDKFVDDVWTGFFKGLEKVSDYIPKAIIEAMGGEFTKGVKESRWFTLSDEQKAANEVVNSYRIMRTQIYNEAGAIKKALEKLSQDDNKNLIKALNGDLAATDLNSDLKPFYNTFRAIIDKNAQKLVDAGVLSEKDKIEHYIKRYYKDYVDEGVTRGSSAAFEKLKKRKDLTYDERVALGMIEDASFVISNTIAEQNVLLQKAEVLKTLAEKYGIDEAKEGYVRVSDASAKTGLKKYGALGGKYIPKDVKMELDNARVVERELDVYSKVAYGLIGMVDHLKVNLTVKNPPTHIYNIASNLLLAGLNGDLRALSDVLSMRVKNKKQFDELVSRANKYGLNSYLDDMEDKGIDFKPNSKGVNIAKSIWKTLYLSQDSKSGAFVRNLYDWEDKIFKVAAFKKNLDAGLPEAEAFKEAVKVYVDYSTPLPAAIKTLDKFGLMPFLHYQFKATPEVAKIALKHPLRAMILGTGIAALKASVFQNDEDELKTPDWANDKINLFGVAEWVNLGNGWYLNAGRMIPGTKFEFEIGGFPRSILNIFNGESPLGRSLYKKKEGQDGYSQFDDYTARVAAMAENYLPPMTLGRYAQRGGQIGLNKLGLAEPRKNYYDEDMTVEELVLRAFGIRHFNEEEELAKNLKKQNKNSKKKKDDFNKSIERAFN